MTKPERSISHAERRERRKKIADAIRSGSRPGVVARKFGVSLEQVRRACHEHDVAVPPPGRHWFRAEPSPA